MCDCNRRGFMGRAASIGLTGLAAALAPAVLFAQEAAPRPPAAPASDKPKVYTCPPCGCPNDGKEFPAPGPCSACGMPMVEKTATPAPVKPDAAPPTPTPRPASPQKPTPE